MSRELFGLAYFRPYETGNVSGSCKIYEDRIEFLGKCPYSYTATPKVEIDPVNNDYYFDCVYQNTSGSQFYVQIEKFDANNTSTSNNSAITPISNINGNSGKIVRVANKRTDLDTDAGGRTTKYIRCRILPAWTNTSIPYSNCTSSVFRLSLREVPKGQTPQVHEVLKTGVVIGDSFQEQGYTSSVFIQKNGILAAEQLWEY